jgi:putative effector of murein hydrolase LrgA (UPF0299 family)
LVSSLLNIILLEDIPPSKPGWGMLLLQILMRIYLFTMHQVEKILKFIAAHLGLM